MGGIVCAIPRNAILRYEEVPTSYFGKVQFDSQMRACYAQSDIAQGVAEAGLGHAACDILAKEDWTQKDRQRLLDILEGLYE